MKKTTVEVRKTIVVRGKTAKVTTVVRNGKGVRRDSRKIPL